MKRLALLLAVGCGLLWLRVPVGPSLGTRTAHAEQTTSGQGGPQLPGSLDELYPPKASGSTWFLTMLGMGTAFSGIATDFMEGDFANAEQGYNDFRSHYAQLPQMVPEWAGNCPSEPMDALGTALTSRDPAKFMPAFDHASEVCHHCHVENMTRVQQKYEWGDFSVLTLTDPVSKQEMSFRIFMRMLDGDLSGIQVDLKQGQVEQARQHALGIAARYETLKEACAACHDSERAYYVDSRILGMIRELDTAVAGQSVDRESVQRLVQGIGMKSCHECHLVHGPAALSRYGE